MKTVYLITNNIGKLASAQSVFKGTNIILKQLKGDYPEIQAETSLQIAKHTATKVAKEKNLPVIREDHSLFLNDFGKFPGPYTNYFDKKIPVEKLLSLIKKDYTGYFEGSLVYAEPNGLTKEYTFQVPIKISKEIKGKRGNWDKILMLKDSNKTIAECKPTENKEIFNQNFKELVKFLENKNK
jgi:XTP/dITP diphosphohydrolase